ncbi:MAG: glutamine--fructose-6-phosphate transaminase (isomerizing) [Clostridia bacterium]|nr:glutamine--fructose-6-phosphate transaminase (isomerizing) [Clostridia bacterium]
MSGIVGYLGSRPAVPILVQGLERLEYQGCDSAGIAVIEDNRLVVIKRAGKLAALKSSLNGRMDNARLGIGHTRWATHGRPSDVNAHPHLDCSGNIAVVHNGIIENYQELRHKLINAGHRFASETDTEVVAHLLEHYYEGDLVQAVLKTLPVLRGSYALAVTSSYHPNELVGVGQHSSLIIGLAEGETYLASSIPAFLSYTRDTYILDDGEIASIKPEGVTVYAADGTVKEKEIFHVNWDFEAAEKGGYEHFMLKEIHEQPRALRATLSGRLQKDQVRLESVDLTPAEAAALEKIVIIACGTARHAGMVGKYLIEKYLRLPVEDDVASEFRYRNPILNERTLGLVISQSGETADTLAGLREAQKSGVEILAVTNVLDSTVARLAKHLLYTWAGPEIAIASTKAYVTQAACMYLLALYLAEKRGVAAPWKAEMARGLRALPDYVEETLKLEPRVSDLAGKLAPHEHAFFIGRGLDYAVSLEGALKLKETSYIHAEAFAAGELKHGPIALINEGTPVIALATQTELLEKMISNIKEVRARGAWVLALTQEGNGAVAQEADAVLYLPPVPSWLAPVVTVLPLQLLAYYTAVARGCDVDKPRNLAKSVTVE